MNYANLRAILKRKNIKRKQLSELIGISENTLTSSINRESQTSILNSHAIIQKLSKVLDVPVSELLNADELNSLGTAQQSNSSFPDNCTPDNYILVGIERELAENLGFNLLKNYYRQLNKQGRENLVKIAESMTLAPIYTKEPEDK